MSASIIINVRQPAVHPVLGGCRRAAARPAWAWPRPCGTVRPAACCWCAGVRGPAGRVPTRHRHPHSRRLLHCVSAPERESVVAAPTGALGKLRAGAPARPGCRDAHPSNCPSIHSTIIAMPPSPPHSTRRPTWQWPPMWPGSPNTSSPLPGTCCAARPRATGTRRCASWRPRRWRVRCPRCAAWSGHEGWDGRRGGRQLEGAPCAAMACMRCLLLPSVHPRPAMSVHTAHLPPSPALASCSAGAPPPRLLPAPGPALPAAAVHGSSAGGAARRGGRPGRAAARTQVGVGSWAGRPVGACVCQLLAEFRTPQKADIPP